MTTGISYPWVIRMKTVGYKMKTKPKLDDIVSRFLLILITLALLVTAGIWILDRYSTEMFRLSAKWVDDQIHVSSPRDGPWYVTHLVVYESEGHWQAIAQLPKPITIIDSRGHHFTREQINALEWTNLEGARQDPPTMNTAIGVMYLVPQEGKHPTNK